MYTIKEIFRMTSANAEEKVNLWTYLGDFLDFFYSKERTTDERYQLILEEPETFDNIEATTYAFLAGAVHKISMDYGVQRPAWVMKEKYFLEKPYFSLNAKGNLRLVLLAESPIPFRMRHIFTSENTLDRI